MAATVKWVVIQAPVGKAGTSGNYTISDATTVIAVIDNGDGTVTIYYV